MLVPMRFNGVEWHHNPYEIIFECDKKVNETVSPCGTSYIHNSGRKNMTVRGTGELCGSDCVQQFNSLLQLFRQNTAGILSIQNIQPFYAVFESLKIVGKPKPDKLMYSFLFREKMQISKSALPAVHFVGINQTLWDISYIYKIPIETLVALNTNIKCTDNLLSGDVVKLC